MQWQSTILATNATTANGLQTTKHGSMPDRIKWRMLYLEVEATVRQHLLATGQQPDYITIILEKFRFEPRV